MHLNSDNNSETSEITNEEAERIGSFAVPTETTLSYKRRFSYSSGYIADTSASNKLSETGEQISFNPNTNRRIESVENLRLAIQAGIEQPGRSRNSVSRGMANEISQPMLGEMHGYHRSSQYAFWKITQADLPEPYICDEFEPWPDGDVNYIFKDRGGGRCKHRIGWVMKNCNNHVKDVLKKSCLGILVCDKNCKPCGEQKIYKPAVCDKARGKQVGSPCPTPECDGKLIHVPCKGKGGYPVTHEWRTFKDKLYFQAEGTHDHLRPLLKFYARKQISKDRTTSPSGQKKLDGTKNRKSLLNSDDPVCEFIYTDLRRCQVSMRLSINVKQETNAE
ncbi:hypothetical protein Aperf_G00000020991 [Anoplocephala perfoliata]